MRIGMMTPGIGRGDAVGNDASLMARALRLAGFDVMLFTNAPSGAGAAKVFTYRDLTWKLDQPDDLIIYHYCTYDPSALAAIRMVPARVILKYHNVTPSAFFLDYSSDFVQGTRLGRKDLLSFLDLPIVCTLSASSYNRDELVSLGADRDRCYVLPPMGHIQELLESSIDRPLEARLRATKLNLLTVGRIVPNKGLDLLIASFGKFVDTYSLDVHLHIVGKIDDRLVDYKQKLDAIVEQRGLSGRVHFHTNVDTEALAAFYRTCDVYWTCSQHEGFCVPAVEAMAFGLPILATPMAALPETCGDAAVYAATEDEHAEALYSLLVDDVRRGQISADGRRRYLNRFSNDVVRASLLEVLDEVARRQAESPSAALRRNWLNLPDFSYMASEILLVWDGPRLNWTTTRDHYLDILDWALRVGRQRSIALRDYFVSDRFQSYLSFQFQSGPDQDGLAPIIRFVYAISRRAQSYFTLQTHDSFTSFSNWFYRQGIAEYGLQDLAGNDICGAIARANRPRNPRIEAVPHAAER